MKHSCQAGAVEDYDECSPVSQEIHGPCAPWWFLNKSSKCPYGQALPGDVTLPKHPTILACVSVFYGFIPYLVAAGAVVEFILKRGTRNLSFIMCGYVTFIVGLGELIFKRIVQQARPTYTCLHSCGMPSSHSTLAVGYFALMFIDASWRHFASIDVALVTPPLPQSSWGVVPLLQPG